MKCYFPPKTYRLLIFHVIVAVLTLFFVINLTKRRKSEIYFANHHLKSLKQNCFTNLEFSLFSFSTNIWDRVTVKFQRFIFF